LVFCYRVNGGVFLSVYKVENVNLIENTEIKSGYFIMSFRSERMLSALPGQFMSLSVPCKMGKDMPLRRPFTVYRLNSGITEVLYKVTGRGTKLFSELRSGDTISCFGPKGNTFPIRAGDKSLLLGRGVGLACLAWLGSVLKKNGKSVVTIASFRDKSSNLMNEYIRDFSDVIHELYDEDGTSSVGNVIRLIDEMSPAIIYTCGSKRLARALKHMPYEAYVSLEEHMGCCGLGSCYTCVVQTNSGEYVRSCKEGPCFNVREVDI
jgi:dihydroorotate dehydrogenase electron transfer subunit